MILYEVKIRYEWDELKKCDIYQEEYVKFDYAWLMSSIVLNA